MSKKGNERIYEILSPSLTCYILLENTTKNWKIYILNILNELVDFLRHLIKLYLDNVSMLQIWNIIKEKT